MTPTDETTVAFIAEIGETSRYLAARNDLYASVMIAQAILESDSGQSQLSQKPLTISLELKENTMVKV